jgi:hypothetical protein
MKNQNRNVAMAIVMTAGTKTPATLSASLWIGALEAWAFSTRRTIWASAVSLPTRVARTLSRPFLLMVPPMTSEFSDFDTGMLSPVSSDSSTEDVPSTTTPSVGIFSPGRTTITSLTSSSSACTWTSTPSLTITAVLACRSIRRRIASEVLLFALASRYLPNRISAMIIVDVS